MEFIGAFVGAACVLGVGMALIIAALSIPVLAARKIYLAYKARSEQSRKTRAEHQLSEFKRQTQGYGYRSERRP